MANLIRDLTENQRIWLEEYGKTATRAQVACVTRHGIVLDIPMQGEILAVMKFYEDYGTANGWRCWDARPNEADLRAAWKEYDYHPDVYDTYMDYEPLGYNPWQE